MPRPERFKNELSPREKERIWEYSTVGLGATEIGKLINRSPSTVNNILSKTRKSIKPKLRTTKVKITKPIKKPIVLKKLQKGSKSEITEEQNKEIAERHLQGEPYNSIANSMGLNAVTVRQHGREYLKKSGKYTESTGYSKIISGTYWHDLVTEQCFKAFKEYLKHSENIPAFIKQYKLTKKTSPASTAPYKWYKIITGMTYTEAKKNRKITTPTTKPIRKVINKAIKPTQEPAVETKITPITSEPPSETTKEIKKLEKRLRELKEAKRIKEQQHLDNLQKQIEALEAEARFE